MYNFSFTSVGGATRVRVAKGEDIAHLGELDQKMWTVLSCPTTGLEIDAESLSLMDSDADGQLHVTEVIKSAEWLNASLANLDCLFEKNDTLKIADIKDEAIRAIATKVAGDKDTVCLADVTAAIDAVTVAEQVAEQAEAVAPYEADVMAAYNEKKAEYAAYYQTAKLAKLGLAVLAEDAVKPGMDEKKFAEMGEKIAAYEAVVAANAAAAQAAADANAAALAEAKGEFTPLKKLLLLKRDFVLLLRNYLTLEDFYDKDPEILAIFQAGTLVIDQRACRLCIRVADMGKHDAQAAAAGMFLIYCDCVNRKTGKTLKIVAAVTVGDIANLKVGKNAIFYDRQGLDYDATIVKVIDNPISIGQAFWSPYRKFGNWITDLINKSAAEKDAKAFEDMKTNATTATENVGKEGEEKKSAFDIAKFAGIFAAIGMAVGFIGQALVSLASGVSAMKWWQLILAIVGILLVISGPSMVLAWMKLRKRNLAPLLNANGWAVNADSIVNVLFGNTLTDKVQFPMVKMQDPFAKKGLSCGAKWAIAIAVIVAVVAGAALAAHLMGYHCCLCCCH